MKGPKTTDVDPSRENVVIVDRNNRVTGAAPRWKMRRDRLIHRATYVMVFNPQGQILVQKRTRDKDIYPGLLEIAAGGVVRAGETYQVSAERELEEETGIKGVFLKPHFDFFFEEPCNRIWGRVFSCTWEDRLLFQEEEVEWGRFYDVSRLDCQIKEGTFTPDSVYLYEACKKRGLFFS